MTLPARRLAWLSPVFFLSGFAALTYQVAWERVLYTIFGINVESVAVVVTAFLLGLGLGSLAGGRVSAWRGCRHLRWFAAAEMCIALFGLVSVPFFHAVGRITLGVGSAGTALVTLGLLVVPTMLMGATLPLLATYAVRRIGNVGQSVGMLYAVNTAGSAVAALLSVTVLLPTFGLRHCVWIAAACNAAVAVVALMRDRMETEKVIQRSPHASVPA